MARPKVIIVKRRWYQSRCAPPPKCISDQHPGFDRAWVFRFLDEKWRKDIIQLYKKGKGISIMVWAAFWGRERANLVRIRGDPSTKRGGYTAISYLEVLEEIIETI